LEDAYERKLTWAFQLTEAGQDEQAMQILTRLLAGYPDNAGLTYTVLAVTHSAAGRLEESEAMARRAIAAAPDYSEAHRLLAHALIYQGKELEAEHSLRTALELSPEDVSLFSLMATALTRMGRTEEALLYAHEAVSAVGQLGLRAVCEAVREGQMPGWICSSRPAVGVCPTLWDRTLCVDVDAHGVTLMSITGEEVTTLVVSFGQALADAGEVGPALEKLASHALPQRLTRP